MMYFHLIVITMVIMALYGLYLEYKIKELRKDLTRVAETLYNLVIVLDSKNIIEIKEGGEDE